MGARTAAPGGGSVSALLAALGAGLGSMVINIHTWLYGGGKHDKKMSNYLDDIELKRNKECTLLLEMPCSFVCSLVTFFTPSARAMDQQLWISGRASTGAWVTRPERPKGVKAVIKQARRAAT